METRPVAAELFDACRRYVAGFSPPLLSVKSQGSWFGICAGQNNNRTGISANTSVTPPPRPVSKGGFTVKLMELKFQGPSFAQTPSTVLEDFRAFLGPLPRPWKGS